MLPRADITGTRPVLLIEASVPSAGVGQPRQETLDRLQQLILGKEYQAQVMSRLTDGNYLVRIDNAAASMKLPVGIQSGDTLELTLVATDPRPTFLLGKGDPNAAAMTSLSTTGRLIGQLLQMAQEEGGNAAIIGRTPLLPTGTLMTAPSLPSQLAAAMQQTLAASGLFYESHVAQWVIGNRPFADLLREPAAKRNGGLTNTQPPSTAGEATAAAAVETKLGNDIQRMVGTLRDMVAGNRLPGDTSSASSLPLHQRADLDLTELAPLSTKGLPATELEQARLINQQLDTLEQRRILWQGELFPGQRLEWEIADESPGKQHPAEEVEAVWRSTLRFSLPGLGNIAANLHLTGSRVQLHLKTDDEETATLLRQHGIELASALEAAGSRLDMLQVSQQDA
ncbi:flagellar hook-length control protein FliK [uncultured Oxalicibacterium sp.]|uniref:flagellar hook-length control protein FliK n=1 Tax=uncultured Oxalicibacterium sp. TaxID=1168540 RepID=UPI0025FD4293|nr:flagellar hook-length control protein FliK [uncultured Oxalicibacterium sp.]